MDAEDLDSIMEKWDVKEKPPLKKFKKDPKYTHHRSEGLTRRRNRGSKLQVADSRR